VAQPPPSTGDPPSVSQVAAGSTVATGAPASGLALGGVAGATGTAAAYAGAAVAGATGAAAIAKGVKAILSAMRAFLRRRGAADIEWFSTTVTEAQARGQLADDDVTRLRRQEKQYEVAFQRKALARWEKRLPRLLAIASPEERALALRIFQDREKRLMEMRAQAMAERAQGAIERTLLKQVSPQGAYWKLNPHVKQHTPDCIVMGEKFWPWSVLEKYHPPRHFGCPCTLYGLQEALARGLMTTADIPNPIEAMRRATVLMARFEEADASHLEGLADRLEEGGVTSADLAGVSWPDSQEAVSFAGPRGAAVEAGHRVAWEDGDRLAEGVISRIVEHNDEQLGRYWTFCARDGESTATHVLATSVTDVLDLGLQEANFAERQHPRDRLGKWIETLGFPAYRVGGAVRDPMLGKSPKDVDYMLMADPQAIKLAVQANGGRADDLIVRDRLVGVRAHVPGLTPPDGVEIAPPRVEVSTGPSRHDFAIEPHPLVVGRTPTPEEAAQAMRDDAVRRDFTVNAMYQNEVTGEVIDPLGGQADMTAGQLRTTSPQSFAEDPLRTLRGLRFMSQHGLALHPDTEQQMVEHAGSITALTQGGVSGTAISELNKLLMGDHVGVALRKARDTGVLASFLPELAPAIGFDQQSKYHKDFLDEHIIQVVENTAKVGAPLEVRLAALFHDSGKPEAAFMGTDGRLHYYGGDGKPEHAVAGARIAREALGRLNYPADTINRVSRIITHHMLSAAPTTKLARVRQWRREVGPDIIDAVLMHRRADVSTKGGEGSAEHLAQLERFAGLVASQAGAPTSRADLAITGSDLIAGGMKPGPEIGKTLDRLVDHVVSDPSLNRRDWLLKQAGVRPDPPVFWHGTSAARARSITDSGFRGQEVFLTTHRQEAADYGSGQVLPVDTSQLGNVLVVSGNVREALARVGVPFEARGGYLSDQTVNALRDKGYDALRIDYPKDVRDPSDPKPARSILRVFDASKLKVGDRLQEAAYVEALHPRDRIGRFSDVPTGTIKRDARMGAMHPRKVVKLLKVHGFVHIRQKGSHAVYEHPAGGRQVIVPMHAKTMPRGTMMHVLAVAGLLEAAVEEGLLEAAEVAEWHELQESPYAEVLHPRDRNGRWVHTIGQVLAGKRAPHGIAETLGQRDRDALLRVLDRADLSQDRRLRKLRAALIEWSREPTDIPMDMHSAIKMMLARRERTVGL
jgi:tRNA nucleotidyltransferase (CCA-adding enzyme)